MPAVHAAEAITAPAESGNAVLCELRALVCSVALNFDAQLLERDAAALAR